MCLGCSYMFSSSSNAPTCPVVVVDYGLCGVGVSLCGVGVSLYGVAVSL